MFIIYNTHWKHSLDFMLLFRAVLPTKTKICLRSIKYDTFVIYGKSKQWNSIHLQYIPRNMHTVFALLCFVVVIHWLIFPYPSGLLHWHCGNLRIAPVPAKQPWWIWINTSCEFIINDCITTTKQSITKPCAYFLGYTVIAAWQVPLKSTHFCLQYIPRNMHTVLLCFALLWLCNRS